MTKALNQMASQRLPSKGPGLFTSERAKVSSEKAMIAITALAKQELLVITELDDLASNILQICQYYWSDKENDERPNLAATQAEMKPIAASLRKANLRLSGISRDLNERLSIELKWLQRDFEIREFITRFDTEAKLILQAYDAMKATKAKKTGPEHVKRCCGRLMAIRESLTGIPFRRNFSPKPGDGNATDCFSSADAHFVLAVLQSIDKDVTFQKAQSAFTAIAKAAPKKKMSSKSGSIILS